MSRSKMCSFVEVTIHLSTSLCGSP